MTSSQQRQEPHMTNQNFRRGVRGEAHAAPDARCQVRWAREFADDIDEAAVQRLLAGDRNVTVTAFERREAVRRLRLQRHTYAEIATLLDMHQRQVGRDLRRFGITQRRIKAAA